MYDIQAKAVAFYLPQYHPVPENSEWWGPGFTEWTNVAKARPIYKDHYQPHIPRELGFYDLRMIDTMREQAAMATRFGVHGFCFYHYWFSGRRILEKPVENWLKSDIDFPYCLCWANENWTKKWDGGNGEVLLEQNHTEEDFRAFFHSVRPHMEDPRYIRVSSKPLLAVYRPSLFPDSLRATEIIRDEARKSGIGELHLCTVQFYGITDPAEFGFDAAIEFPPHTFLRGENLSEHVTSVPSDSAATVVDYRKIIAQALDRPPVSYRRYRGVIPSWDNTPRRHHDPVIITHSRPDLYRYWLTRIVHQAKQQLPEEERLVFINAWNEWGEGCHLEPDLKHGLDYLKATFSAVTSSETELEVENAATIGPDGVRLTGALVPFPSAQMEEIDEARRARLPAIKFYTVTAFVGTRLRRYAPWLFGPARAVYHGARKLVSRLGRLSW